MDSVGQPFRSRLAAYCGSQSLMRPQSGVSWGFRHLLTDRLEGPGGNIFSTWHSLRTLRQHQDYSCLLVKAQIQGVSRESGLGEICSFDCLEEIQSAPSG